MKDPNRIVEVLERLGDLWRKYPDFRLGQLICMLSRKRDDPSHADIYDVEDDDLLEAIRRLLGIKTANVH